MRDSEGKVAAVVNGEAIVAADIAQELARRGYSIMIHGLCTGLAGDVASLIRREGGQALVYQGDLSQEAEALDFIQVIIGNYGRLDTLIIGVESSPPPYAVNHLIPDLEWTQTVIKSTFLMTHYALPYLRATQGSIQAICSELCSVANPSNAPHESAMKAWLHGFIQGVAQEQTDSQVRANFICSRFGESCGTVGHPYPLETASAMGVEAMDVPGLCGFLASDEGRYVTGALYTIRDRFSKSELPMELVTNAINREFTDELRSQSKLSPVLSEDRPSPTPHEPLGLL